MSSPKPTAAAMAEPHADSDHLPLYVRRAFFISFVTGLIEFIPALVVTYGSFLISGLSYMSWVFDRDLDFLQNTTVRSDPIEARRGVPRQMVLLICIFTISVVLLLLVCVFAILIGARGTLGKPAVQVPRAVRILLPAISLLQSLPHFSTLAKRISRMGAFYFAAVMPTLALVVAWGIWSAQPALIAIVIALVLLVLLQIMAMRVITQHTTSLSPRGPGESRVLVISFLLVFILLLQLCLTPIIGGNANSGSQWDNYSTFVEVFQTIAAIVSAVSALIGLVFALAAFVNNSDVFSVRLCCPVAVCWLPAWHGARYYRLCIGLNFIVMLIGVLMTAIINGVMFRRNDQPLGTQKVFWAAFEQPFVSFLVLTGASVLEFLASPNSVYPAPSTQAELAQA